MPSSERFGMPVMQPIPIPTAGRPWYTAIWAWLFTVRRWRLVTEYRFRMPGVGIIIVPAGFDFDGASIPKIFWLLLSPTGLLLIPGLFHDYGYRYNKLLWLDGNHEIMESSGYARAYWDDLFESLANYVNGLAPVNRVAANMVRLFGGLMWRRYRRRERESYETGDPEPDNTTRSS